MRMAQDEEQRRQDEDPGPGRGEIEETLQEELPLLSAGRLEVKEGQSIELCDRRPSELRIEQIDGDRHDDPFGLAIVDRALERVQSGSWNNENDLVHRLPMKDAGDVLEAPEDRQPADLMNATAGLVIDGPDDFETPFWMPVDPLHELNGPLSGSHDQQTPCIETLAADIMRAHEDGRFFDPNEQQAEANEQKEKQPAHERQLEQEDEGAEHQEGHDR